MRTCLLFKLIFFIYILLNFNIAQASSDEIWLCYNDQNITLKRNILELMKVSKVANLVEIIKMQLQDEKSSDKVVTLRREESQVISSETSVDELYNTKNQALHVVVGKHNIQLYLL